MSLFSPSVSTVNVHANYRVGDGPDSGSVVFTFTDRLVSATDDVIFASGASFEAKLGVNTGSISVDLPCVDDPDISPNNWSIKVEEKLKSGRGATYFIKPTLAMVATGFNLRTVQVPGSLPAPEATVRIGVPGGLAVYNSNGDVIDAAGNVITGGSGGTGGPVSSASITDATTLGKSLLTVNDAAAARALLSALPTSYAPAWTQVTGKPAVFPPSAHGHNSADIADLTEQVQDIVAAMLTAGTNVTLAYDDTTGKVTIAASGSGGSPYKVDRVRKFNGVWGPRPTDDPTVLVFWQGPDPSPAAVTSGTDGMYEWDVRLVTP